MSFPTTGILDTFNRADEGPPMTGWTAYISVGLQVSSNQCAPNDAGDNGAYWTSAIGGADVEAYVTIATLPPTGGETSIFARLNPAGGGGVGTCYEVNHAVSAGTDTISINRFDGDDIRHTLTSTSQDLAAGDKLGIACIGNNIAAWYFTGGSWLSVGSFDSTYAGTGSNNKIGLYSYGNGVSTVARYDSFGGGVAVTSTDILLPTGIRSRLSGF